MWRMKMTFPMKVKKKKKKNHQTPSPVSFFINSSETWEGGGKKVKRCHKIFPNLTAETASNQIFFSELLRVRYRGKEIQNSTMKCVRISRECFWSQVISNTSHRRNWPVAEVQRSPSLPSSPLPSLPPLLCPHSLSHLLSHLPSISLFLLPPYHSSLFLPIFPGSFSILPLGSQTWQKMTNSHRGERTGSVWQSAGGRVGTRLQAVTQNPQGYPTGLVLALHWAVSEFTPLPTSTTLV